jgi:hypothetical protein
MMPRRWALASILFALTTTAVAQPPGASDDLTYRDRSAEGKLIDVKAETKESVAGVQIIVAGKVKTVVSPADVVRYDYGSLPGTDLAALAVARSMERGGDAAKAHAAYADLLKKLPANAPEKTRRHLTFREAMTSIRLADAKSGGEFATDATRAAAKLTDVFRAAKKNWEAWPSARTAARLHAELGQFDKAAALYGELAGIAELPRDLKFEARLDEAAALIRAGQGLSADAVLEQLEKDRDFPAGPMKEQLAILRIAARAPKGADARSAETVSKLEAAIAQAKDAAARASGYNFLGDVHAANGRTRDAMWSYLWVDTVYNQDRDEQILALHRLADLFDRTGDKDRADQFRDKLTRVR